MLKFVGGSSEYVDPDVSIFSRAAAGAQRVDYSNVTVKDLKKG